MRRRLLPLTSLLATLALSTSVPEPPRQNSRGLTQVGHPAGLATTRRRDPPRGRPSPVGASGSAKPMQSQRRSVRAESEPGLDPDGPRGSPGPAPPRSRATMRAALSLTWTPAAPASPEDCGEDVRA